LSKSARRRLKTADVEAIGFDTLALLALVAVFAGFVDAIAGGGGLITVPALALAGLDPITAVATNKVQSCFGSGSATLAFARAGHIRLRELWPLGLACAGGSVAGAMLLTHVPKSAAGIALPIVLLLVAGYFAFAPKMGAGDQEQVISPQAFTLIIAPLVGGYDGLFGPGAGSFYMLGFVSLLGFGLVKATGHTKFANFASNLAGLATLALSGHIIWMIGLVMGVGAFIGAQAGSRMTMLHGARLVRPLIVAMCCLLALRLGFDALR
jgi:uncharacterized protein